MKRETIPFRRNAARGRAASLALMLVALGVFAAAASAAGAGAPPKGTIVVGRDLGGGNLEIFALDLNKGTERNLTNNPASDQTPMMSANGEIAFATNRDAGNWEIYVVDLRGNLRRVTSTPAYDEVTPAWSQNGRKIAFTRAPAGALDACIGPPFTTCGTLGIYVMNADGSNPQLVTDEPGAEDSGPRWSPNGKKISFTSDRSGDYDVWTIDADGTNPTNLTNDPAFHDGVTWPPATWSPDGGTLAFGRMPLDFDFSKFEIYTINADGSDLRQLTDAESDGPAFTAVWSPNGQQIAFLRFGETDSDLFVMNADGTDHQVVKDTPEDEHGFDWGH